ncbi:MAG: ATP-binding protein [Acidimicrobiales bacterium]
MRLPDDDHAASTARRVARQWASHEGLPEEVVGDLELVVSELVTNARRHGLPPYHFDLRRVDGVIRGEVCDGLPLAPRPKQSPDETGGFGLGIVNSCASQWGTQTLPTGKQVWFELKP